ncbi:hypothetical protein, partial [Candidatus Ichthyocystis sparus]
NCRFSCNLSDLCVFPSLSLLKVISAMLSPFSGTESGSSCRDKEFSNESTMRNRFWVCKSLNKNKKNKAREMADFM